MKKYIICSIIVSFVVVFLLGMSRDNAYADYCPGSVPCITSNDIINGSIVGGDVNPAIQMPGTNITNNSVQSIDIQNGTIGGVDINSAEVQTRVSGTCALGNSIRTINSDGTVVCEPDDIGAIASDVVCVWCVGTTDISPGAVGATQISDSSVTSADIAADTITSADIAVGGVGSSELSINSVNGTHLAAGAVSVAGIAFMEELDAQVAIATGCQVTRNWWGPSYMYYADGAACDAVAPINFPDGVSLSQLSCLVFDNTVSASIYAQLIKVNLTTGASTFMGTTTTSVDSVSPQTLSDIIISEPLVDNSNYAYYLHTDWSNADLGGIGALLAHYGCKVSYQ